MIAPYLGWIRSLPCLICGGHLRKLRMWGLERSGQKCSDRETGLLCAWDHRIGPHSHHALGRQFWPHYSLDRAALIRGLNERYNAIANPIPR